MVKRLVRRTISYQGFSEEPVYVDTDTYEELVALGYSDKEIADLVYEDN